MQQSYNLSMTRHSEEIKIGSRSYRLMKMPAEIPYRCEGCKERDVRPCYKHKDAHCNSHLHKECYDSSSCKSSSIMFNLSDTKSNCDFIFQKEALGGKGVCDACGDDVKGWLYKCKTCKKPHYLHPCCAKLPIMERVNTKNGEVIIDLKAESRSKCLLCGHKENPNVFRGRYYISRCGNYCFHWSCMKHLAVKKWKKDGDQCDIKRKTELSSQALKTTTQKTDTIQHANQQRAHERGKNSRALPAKGRLDSGNQKRGCGTRTRMGVMQPSQDTKQRRRAKAMDYIVEAAIDLLIAAVDLLIFFIPLIFSLPPLPWELVRKWLK